MPARRSLGEGGAAVDFKLTVGKPSFLEGRRTGDRRSLVSRVEFLQPHLLGVLGLNPAAQVIRQRGVHPITARA